MAFRELRPVVQEGELVAAFYAQLIQQSDVFMKTGMGTEPVGLIGSPARIPDDDLRQILFRLIEEIGCQAEVRYQSAEYFDGRITEDGKLAGFYRLVNLSGRDRSSLIIVSFDILPTPLALVEA
jgi:hypothetical protein